MPAILNEPDSAQFQGAFSYTPLFRASEQDVVEEKQMRHDPLRFFQGGVQLTT